jgi:hypothetical protein
MGYEVGLQRRLEAQVACRCCCGLKHEHDKVARVIVTVISKIERRKAISSVIQAHNTVASMVETRGVVAKRVRIADTYLLRVATAVSQSGRVLGAFGITCLGKALSKSCG